MRSATALLLACVLLATAALAVESQRALDPLAQYRAPDGSLHIPGRAFTPELQHLLFGGNDLQPFYNLSYYGPARSPYPTMQLVERGYQEPNLNVFAHPTQEPETLGGAIAHLVDRWFPPVDWGAQFRSATNWFFGLFMLDARAAVVVDSTTVADVSTAANTCTTSQTAAAADNAILVMLSERGTNAFLSVTYGSVSLTLIASTAQNGGTVVRTEIWGFAGALPSGAQTMTATLSGGNPSRMTCATILLQGVKSTGSFFNGTSNTASSTNATITLSASVASGNLGFAVAALQNAGGPGVQPTAVSGTGATATDLYGVTTGHCTGGGAANECAAGADIPNPGTAITWTSASTTWVVSAVEVVATPTCGTVGGGNCYRIGAGGAWNSPTNWSNSPGGASCGCTPVATDVAIFNGSPTGTTTLAAATTIAAIDMTGFTGTLDTTASNWPLTVNGPYTIQGTFLPRGSTITVSGNVTVLGAATVVTMSSSSWTVSGTWTNNSTSASWSAGTGTVTIKDGANGTLTFANLGVNEFNNLTLDVSVTAGLSYTMATNGLQMGGTLTIQNSTAGATGSTILDTSPSNLAVTAGALTVSTWGAFNTEGSTITINGNVNISAATGFVTNAGGGWTVTGSWTDASTSASWSFAAAMNFRAPASRTMTFGVQAGNEFSGAVTFDTTVTIAVTYTMTTNPLGIGGVLTIQNSTAGATGAVTLDASAGNLSVTAGGLTQSTLGAFNTRASTITVNGDVSISAPSAYVTNTGGSWTVSGAWTDRTTSASWSFAAAMTFRAAASKTMTFTGSNIAGNEFGAAVTFDTTAIAGVIYTMAAGATGDASLKIGGALTIRNSAGGATAATILDTSAGNYSITAASLTLGSPRGALRSEGSAITINGAVNVSDANSYLVLGSATWTVTGSWTDSSTDGVDWSAGTGTLTFRDGANATMTFANLGVNELNNVVFDTSAAAGITYTMATNGLRVAGTVTVQNTAATPTGNVVLTTSLSNLALTAGGIVIGTRGTLTANGSTITVNGSWTSTAANHAWNKGTSTVVFGASGTLTMSAGDSFNIMTQSAGTTTLGSNVTVSGASTINGTLDTSASNFALTLQSTLSIGATGLLNLEASTASTAGNVTIAAGGAVRFTGAGTWTINGTWTDNNTIAPASWAVSTSTVRIVGAAAGTLTFWTAAGANEFNNLTLDSSVAAGFTYTQANALQTAGALTIQNTAAGATGTVILDATASNFNSTLGGLVLGALGAYASRGAVTTLNGNVSIAASGYITSAATGTWTVNGTWTNGTTSGLWFFAAPITFKSSASQTMTFKATGTEFGGAVTFDTTSAAGVTYTLATNGLTLAGLLTIQNSVASPTGNAVLDTSTANLGITAGSVTIGTNGTLRAQGSTISVGGSWTVTAGNATFTAGTSTVVFTAAASVNMTQAFNNLTISAGTSTLAANTTVNATLTVSGGTLAKGTFTLSTSTLNLSGGALTSTSGAGTVTGNATISSPASYVSFGSETWTIGGTWSNSSTSASWSAGTGTVVFRDGSAATMTFAGTNLAGNEFNNVTFDTTAMTGVTYTMSTRGLRVGGVLTVQNSSAGATGATILDTSVSNLAVTAGALALSTMGAFKAEGSTVTINGNVNVSASSAYVVLGTSAWTVTGSWTSASTSGSWTAGTSTVTIKDGASTTLTFANLGINEFNNLTLDTSAAAGVTYTMAANGLRIGGVLQIQNTVASPTGNAVLVTSNLPVTAGAVTVGTNGTLSAGSSTITVGGNWTVTAVNATFLAGTSTVSFGANATVTMTQSFYNLAVTAGTTTMASNVTVGATLTVSGGTYAKGTTTLTTVALALSGGALTSTSGNVTISGNVNISAAPSYIAFGSELWSVAGTWTNASTSASWSAGTGTVTFTSPTGGTMTFAGTNLSGNEFNNLTFTSSAATAQTFTMSTRALRVGGTLMVSDGSSTTTLDTSASNLAVSAVTLTVGAGGALTARGSSLTVTSIDTSAGAFTAGTSTIVVNASGGTVKVTQTAYNLTVNGGVSTTFTAAFTWSGTLTLTSSTPTFNVDLTSSGPATLTFASATLSIAGSWNTASATAFTATSSTVTFSGSSKTITLAAGQAFAALTISGTISQSSQLTASGPLIISTASSLTTSNNALTAQGTLTINGTGFLATGTSTVAITGTVSITAAAAYITSSGGSWTVTNGSWTNSSTSASWSFAAAMTFVSNASQTMTWGNMPGNEFAGAVTFDSNVVAGVTYTSAANALDITGTMTVQNSAAGATGPTVLSTGSNPYFNISAGAVSVGTYGSLVANSSTLTVSGNWNVTAANATFTAGTSTVSFGAAATVTMTQSFYNLTVTAGTVTAGSNITVSNALNLSAGIFAKTTATLYAASLTLSGGALTSTSGNVTISGNVNIPAAASYLAFGSESWTVSGSWTNASTSASWNAGTATVTFSASSAQAMTFAGSNLAGVEFNNVTFNSGPSTVTFTLATRGLRVGSTLLIGGGTGTTTLDTSGSNLAISANTLNVIVGGALTANGSTITTTSIDTHLGALTAGTSTVVVNASGGTVNISQTVNNLTVSPATSTTFSGSLTWSGTLTLTGATVAFGASSLTSSGAATMTFASTVITMTTGNWDTSSATTFTATGSSVTLSGTGNLAIGPSSSFGALTVSGGARTLLSQLTVAGLLTLSGGTLAKGSNTLTANGGLTLSGGALTSTSGAVTIIGDATISAAVSYISFGSEAWTLTGSWTNASASATWAVGTATVTFTSASSQTMTFAALPAGAPEFYNMVFNSGASSVTFTMAGNPLVWSGTLTVQGGSGTTALATSGLALTGGAVSVGNAGVLTANASTVSVSDVTMTGGTSGMIVLTSGAWTVIGNWNTSGSGSTLSAGTSTVTLTGTAKTINLAPGQMFHNLTIGGTVSTSSTVTALATLTVNNGAVLTKTGQSIAFNGLAEIGTGSITDGTVTVVNFTVTNSDATNLTTISAFTMWTVDSEYKWTDSSTVGTSTLTFTIGGNSLGGRFYVTKDGAAFSNGLVDGSGRVVFTMLGSDPVVDVVVAAPCGGTRYWVSGTGNWSQSAHWSSTSGGVGGCSVPSSAMAVFFDAASGGGTIALDQNAVMASLNTTGWTGTIGLSTFNLAVSGNITHAAGTITIGASAGSGLTATGNLTVSGSAVLDGSGAASLVSIGGNTTIPSATAYFRMGSGTWTFSGSWSNASTSANWAVGTGTVVFSSATSQTLTFTGSAAQEFYNVTFTSTAGSGAVVFTMGTNPLKWINTLTIQDSAGSTTTLVTANLSLTGGSLIVGNSGILTANASAVSVVNVTMNAGTSGTMTLTTGTWTVSGNWDTSGAGSVFTKGTSTVTMSGATGTIRILGPSAGFYNLTVSGTVSAGSALDVSSTLSMTGTLTTSGNAITGGANLTISGGGSLTGTTSSLSVASVTMNDASGNTLSLTTGSVSASSSWDTSGASSIFSAGTSTVTLTGASGTITLGASQAFAALVLSGGYTLASQLTASSLTLSSGAFGKGTYPLTVNGGLTLSGGSLTSISGSVTITGNVDVSSASSYIVFGSEAWTISGSWTNASTSASWSVGTGTVTFNASTPQTMTFAGANLSGNEFNAVVFNSGSSTVTFTMAVAALHAHLVTIQGGSGTTTLTTSASNLAITADTLTVAAGGALAANGSIVAVRSMGTSAGSFTAGTSTIVVNASGGSVNIPQVLSSLTVNPGIGTTFSSNVAWSVTLTLTGATAAFSGDLSSSGPATLNLSTATITIAGSWTTPSAAALVSLGSVVTFTGLGQTIALGAGQQFATLTIAGTIALASNLTAESLTVNASYTLTKTNYGIAFNSLTVNGTIRDGALDVSGLTVTNSDGTALITISVFTAWSVGSAYAWTHSSSETSQTITWTIRGNTAGYLYTVTKDRAPFANGTVNSPGEVVFSMLGSDPDMRVDVAAPIVIVPPPPEWWQAPYILAIPPIGFFMVVAMFAQRRRWRPAKAFLVDERGQLLREFTLDPSCQVTYEQACQAGALDAQEKDVKVSKYHARTVVGDALAVVLLAYGPVNLQEVEFAREILANIQDKFEDRVKARLEEARAAEATFEDRTKVLQEGEADLQARSRVFGDMVNAFTVARGKLNADAASLGTREADLASRETLVDRDRASIDELARQLESLRNSVNERTASVEEREANIAQTAETLSAREEALTPRERSLSQRESDLEQKGSSLREQMATLAAAQDKLAGDTQALQARSAELDGRDEELADERKALDDLTTESVAERKALDARTAELEARETELAKKLQEIETRESSLTPKEDRLSKRDSNLSAKESAFQIESDALAAGEASLAKDTEAMVVRMAELDGRTQELAEERTALEALAQDLDRRQQALDAQLGNVKSREETVTLRINDLETLKNNLGPRETAVLEKENDLEAQANGLADREAQLLRQTDLVAAKALEIQQAMETVKEKEEAMARDRALLYEARAGFEAEHREFQSSEAAFQKEMQSRRDELDAQGRSLGEQQLKLAREREDFEAHRADKSQWIASKDIELEAREQSLMEKEAAVRAQAEENARALADLAAREENLEIESSKIEKARAELEAKKAELAATSRDLEAKAVRSRDEEARKAEELRTWQSTLESEQSLLKEQRESFEAEMAEVRESWAGRMLRVEQREAELEERETKVQGDVEWVARNGDEIAKRQKTAEETLKAANALKAEVERLQKELEQRGMEVESRERSVREDAANFSVELQKRTEAIAAAEADLAGRRAQTDRELVTKAQRLQERDEDLAKRAQSLDAKLSDLEGRELKLTSMQDSLREEGDRIAREHSDLQSLAQQIEAKQLQLAQTKERQEAEANRLREEADAMRQSLAAKEADLRSERDRLERESSSLQDKLGAKAQEMAAREKGLNAREDELRSEEQDFESRVREIDSRDRQLQAHAAEIQTQAQALSQHEKELTARSAQFDQTVHKFEAEAAAKRREWEDLQATLKSQEAQLAASTETRQSEIAKRMEDLDHRERSGNATMTQLQIERSRLDAQAKALGAKEAEVAGSLSRSEKRFSELKAMDEELLRSRQAFESERAAWSARRSDELKQLEATRDAAGDQTQQAERLIEESQRRAFVASEAEKAAKRQADELAARQTQLEARRAEAEKSERDLQAQMAQFTELSQRIATRENELAARIRELESRQGRLSAAEQANTAAADELKSRKASLDQETARLGTVIAEAERRRAEDNARHASIEAKLDDIAKRDQQLATELQRADNLMEDLARKETSIQAREKGFASREAEFAQRETAFVERSKELMEGMTSLEKMKKDHTALTSKTEDEHRVAASERREAETIKSEAEKMKIQSEAMQAEVSKNMRFLQKKALDVLDREEKVRMHEVKGEEEDRSLEMRAQILEGKEKTLEVERDDLISKMEKLKAENEKLRAKLADQEKAQKPMVDMEEWKRDIDNRVKIIQRKALELLDREEKLRKREEDLRTLAEQLGVKP